MNKKKNSIKYQINKITKSKRKFNIKNNSKNYRIKYNSLIKNLNSYKIFMIKKNPTQFQKINSKLIRKYQNWRIFNLNWKSKNKKINQSIKIIYLHQMN